MSPPSHVIGYGSIHILKTILPTTNERRRVLESLAGTTAENIRPLRCSAQDRDQIESTSPPFHAQANIEGPPRAQDRFEMKVVLSECINYSESLQHHNILTMMSYLFWILLFGDMARIIYGQEAHPKEEQLQDLQEYVQIKPIKELHKIVKRGLQLAPFCDLFGTGFLFPMHPRIWINPHPNDKTTNEKTEGEQQTSFPGDHGNAGSAVLEPELLGIG